jgi:hypothetical protein
MDESAHLRGLLTQLNTLGGKNGPTNKKKSAKKDNKTGRDPYPEPSAKYMERSHREASEFIHAYVPPPPLTPQQRAELDRASGFPMTPEERQAMERATTSEKKMYERHLHEERTAALRRRQEEEDEHYYASQARSGAAAGPRRY